MVDEIYNTQNPLIDKSGNLVDPSRLGKYLKAQGYDIEMVVSEEKYAGAAETYRLAIRKTPDKPRLKLPLKLVTPEQMGIDLTKFSGGRYMYIPPTQKYLYGFTPPTL